MRRAGRPDGRAQRSSQLAFHRLSRRPPSGPLRRPIADRLVDGPAHGAGGAATLVSVSPVAGGCRAVSSGVPAQIQLRSNRRVRNWGHACSYVAD